jgi:hypothetical protein
MPVIWAAAVAAGSAGTFLQRLISVGALLRSGPQMKPSKANDGSLTPAALRWSTRFESSQRCSCLELDEKCVVS